MRPLSTREVEKGEPTRAYYLDHQKKRGAFFRSYFPLLASATAREKEVRGEKLPPMEKRERFACRIQRSDENAKKSGHCLACYLSLSTRGVSLGFRLKVQNSKKKRGGGGRCILKKGGGGVPVAFLVKMVKRGSMGGAGG